jgi:uncharacterized protein YecE (DUF72 family)/alkylated DNA nucleotide flippase Atl1
MSGEIRVGTSGWQYDDWRGVVYPQGVGQARWLEHYVTLFPTVEVNSTHYRLAREHVARRWAETAPAGFEFVLKGSQYITHRLRLKDAEGAVERFFAPLAPVLDRTSVILWQLPPRWRRDVDRLDAFLGLLPGGHRYAVEFRDDDWFHPDSYEVLDRHGAGHVWVSSSLTSAHHDDVRTGDHVYLRFHGLAEEPYRYDYSRAELEPWARRLLDVAADGTPAWVFFNNDHHGHAVRNARVLMRLLGDAARRLGHEDTASRPPLPPGGQPDPPERALTPFQRRVVEVVRDLAPGEVVTYGDVAMEAGAPGAAQAAANVLRRVPDLPWWRVVPATGRLYRTHAPVQTPLLTADGVRVDEHRRVGTSPVR